jgi:hypothetical protein
MAEMSITAADIAKFVQKFGRGIRSDLLITQEPSAHVGFRGAKT